MQKEEQESLTQKNEEDEEKKKKKKKKKKKRKDGEEGSDEEKDADKKKSSLNNDMFIIGTYNLIKMLGFGTFGEIHLAYDTSTRQLRAIKFEVINQKNPQLKHEFNILEQLNKIENGLIPEGVPKVYGFDRIENKCNYMIMDFLGPSVADLFQFRNKQFTMKTVCLVGIMMLQRIEFIHEKGFIHRDIKPENFVVGLNEKSSMVHIIDFGLSKRYKDKNTGQHIPYRENRHLVGTARYASINAHLGIEQSRRDDIESIGYVLVYLILGRLPWQSKQEKGKQPAKIMEKKLITPPEILCRKLPMEFSYYFHYCKNLKYEDRPDYATLKSLFFDLVMQNESVSGGMPEFTLDWFEDDDVQYRRDEDGILITVTNFNKQNDDLMKKKTMFDLDQNKIIGDEDEDETPGNANNPNEEDEERYNEDEEEHGDLINFKDINSNFQPKFGANDANGPERGDFSSNRNDVIDNLMITNDRDGATTKKSKKKKAVDYDNWSEQSSGGETERENPRIEDDGINKIIKGKRIIIFLCKN